MRPKKTKAQKSKEWRLRFPLKAKAHDVNCYVHRKYKDRGSITGSDVEGLLQACGGICVRCGEPFPAGRFTFDHVMPLLYNGPNHYENIQLLCAKCNRDKHTMDGTIRAWTHHHKKDAA